MCNNDKKFSERFKRNKTLLAINKLQTFTVIKNIYSIIKLKI